MEKPPVEASRQTWLYVRVAAVSLSALFSGISINEMPGDFSKPSIAFALAVAGFCTFGLVFVRAIQ
jgi:hypothetical protein